MLIHLSTHSCCIRNGETRSFGNWLPSIAVLTVAAVTLIPAGDSFSQPSWSVNLNGISTFSSPRATDLNADGIADIIVGAGREEFMTCDSAIFALDGASGKMLWHVGAIDQVFGSPVFMDINNDHVLDVFIHGRSAILFAIDGRSGELLWKFENNRGKRRWFNFYQPQFIKDQNGDGLMDILISNGGNVKARPYDEAGRYAGYLAVLSSRDGSVLAKASMPDKKETYMSVSALPFRDSSDYHIIFGTGGETTGGNLFVTTLSAVLKGELSEAKLLDTSPQKGFVGPAVWANITTDTFPDIVANAVEGKLVAFDGRTYAKIWSVKIPDTEAYSSIAPGYFTDDDIPDFFVSYAMGQWPKLEWSKQVMVDGSSGEILYLDSLGFYQTSTPVVIDLDDNGRDEALLSVNIHVYDEQERRQLYNMIVHLDFASGEVNNFTEPMPGSNISSTPWIGDLDGDHLLDIVYCHSTNVMKPYTFDGMQVNRVATGKPLKSEIIWGSYMGSRYDGIYYGRRPRRIVNH